MKFENILICVDHTSCDKALIDYTEHIINYFAPKKIEFLHVDTSGFYIEQIKKELAFFELENDWEVGLTKQARERAETFEKDLESLNALKKNDIIRYSVINAEHSVMDAVLRFAEENNTDLILLGKKKKEDGFGVIARKIARKSNCSVLFVPCDAGATEPKRYLIPYDFSHYADEALKVFNQIREEKWDITANCFHAYEIMPLNYSMPVTFKELKDTFKNRNQELFDKKLNELNINPESITYEFCVQDYKVAKHIKDEFMDTKYDIMLIGSKGRSAANSMLLGSVTESLLEEDLDIPVLVVKKKGQQQSLIDALLGKG